MKQDKMYLINKIFNEISNLGISIRGIYGENTKGEGSIYQISNQKTLGVTEEQIIELNSIYQKDNKYHWNYSAGNRKNITVNYIWQ